MKKGGGSESTIIIGSSKVHLVYALHSLVYVLGLARFRVFVPNYIYIFEYINISTKTTCVEKMFFCPHFHIYQHFGVKHVFWYYFEKIVFYPYIRKYQYFGEKNVILRSYWKKNYFCPYIRKYQYFKKNNVFWDHFDKIIFCP